MKRPVLLALALVGAGASGCASNAKYVEKRVDGGVVAVPNDSDAWPGYNRQAALKLIEQHVGPDYEIVGEKTVSTGRAARGSLPSTSETLNPRRPSSPGYQSSTHATSMPEATQFEIAYRRKGGALAGDAGAVQTQYAPGGAAPNVQPAGGVMTSPFNRPTVPPAPGTPGCDT